MIHEDETVKRSETENRIILSSKLMLHEIQLKK
jgi:hypothetical protein